MTKIFGVFAVALLFSYQSHGQVSEGLNALLDKPNNYGIVIGNKTGIIKSINFEEDNLKIASEISGKNQIFHLIKSANKNTWISSKADSFSLVFNEDGTAKGLTESGKDVFILLGERSNDSKVITDLSKKGLREISMNLVVKNKLPGHDAPTWFYFQSEDYLQISYVFPVGFVHPSYGQQDHVRIFKFEKKNDEWRVREDNTSVIL